MLFLVLLGVRLPLRSRFRKSAALIWKDAMASRIFPGEEGGARFYQAVRRHFSQPSSSTYRPERGPGARQRSRDEVARPSQVPCHVQDQKRSRTLHEGPHNPQPVGAPHALEALEGAERALSTPGVLSGGHHRGSGQVLLSSSFSFARARCRRVPTVAGERPYSSPISR